MANKILWSPEDSVELLTTELDGMANLLTVLSAEVNPVNEQYIMFSMRINNVINQKVPTSHIRLFLLPSIDGAYPLPITDPAGEYSPQYRFVNFHFREDTVSEVSISTVVNLPFGNFKVAITNRIEENLNATGNVLKYRLGSPEVQ